MSVYHQTLPACLLHDFVKIGWGLTPPYQVLQFGPSVMQEKVHQIFACLGERVDLLLRQAPMFVVVVSGY